MIGAMATSTSIMLGEWEKSVEDGGGSVEVEAHEQMTKLTVDIIARMAFGSSFEEGKKIIYQNAFLISLGQSVIGKVPGYR